jgi:hypothetical protein
LAAERFIAIHAVMLVHSFSQHPTGFDDYSAFLQLLEFRRLKALSCLPPIGTVSSSIFLGLRIH